MLYDDTKIEIPEDQVHKGGAVSAKSSHVIPLDGGYAPHHQGTKAEWQRDDYAEYAHIGESWSQISRDAHRIKINLQTEFTNHRRYHDWKGYDEVYPVAHTYVMFNDRKVGTVRGYANNTLSHLVQVHQYINDLQALGQFGWFSDEDINKVIGKQVDYDGYPGVVVDTLDDMGEITIYCPTWPDDGYDRGGRLRCPALYEKINWYPDPNRPAVSATDPYVGPAFVED